MCIRDRHKTTPGYIITACLQILRAKSQWWLPDRDIVTPLSSGIHQWCSLSRHRVELIAPCKTWKHPVTIDLSQKLMSVSYTHLDVYKRQE